MIPSQKPWTMVMMKIQMSPNSTTKARKVRRQRTPNQNPSALLLPRLQTHLPCRATPEIRTVPIPEIQPRTPSQPSPYLPRARAPTVGTPAKPLPPSLKAKPTPNYRLQLKGSRSMRNQLSLGLLPWLRPWAPRKMLFHAYRITPVYSLGCRGW